MAERNHYQVLGVSKQARTAEIEDHYHHRLHEVHPDRNPGDEDVAMERTVELLAAYRVLADPQARRLYDFKIAHPFKVTGETPGMKLMKNKDKKEAELRFAEGVRFWQRDETAKAVECLKAAIKLAPDFSAASYDLALLGALLGNHLFSLDILAQASQRDPKDIDLQRLNRGVVATFMSV